MHPVLTDQLARLRRAELHRAAEQHRRVAAVTRRNRPVRPATPGVLARMSAGLWHGAVPRGREAEPCPP